MLPSHEHTNNTHTHLSSLYLLLSCYAICLCFALVVLDHAYSWLCSRLGLLVLYSVLCPVFSLSLARSLGCVVLFHLAVLMFALLLVLDVLCSTSNAYILILIVPHFLSDIWPSHRLRIHRNEKKYDP